MPTESSGTSTTYPVRYEKGHLTVMAKRAPGIDYRWQVGKARGEFTAYCRTKPCSKELGRCGAAPGEHCITPSGKRAAVPHQARWPRLGGIPS